MLTGKTANGNRIKYKTPAGGRVMKSTIFVAISGDSKDFILFWKSRCQLRDCLCKSVKPTVGGFTAAPLGACCNARSHAVSIAGRYHAATAGGDTNHGRMIRGALRGNCIRLHYDTNTSSWIHHCITAATDCGRCRRQMTPTVTA